MYTSNLRNVGGSVMIAIPKAMRDALGLTVDSKVDLTVNGESLVIKPVHKPHYSLDELLAKCDMNAPITQEDNDWLNDTTSGREEI